MSILVFFKAGELMIKNNDKILDLEKYLADTTKNSNLEKLSKRLRVLISYYKGVSNEANAAEHSISTRTIQRWVKKYETGGKYNVVSEDYAGRIPKINEKQKSRIESDLKINPLELGLDYSIWNGRLLKRYINDVFGIQVSKIYCEKVLNESSTIYKSNNYDAKKNKNLEKITKNLINVYEKKDGYSVWYFDTYYLGRSKLKELIEPEVDEIDAMIRGNDIYTYQKYILYGFYNNEEMGDIEYSLENNINKKTFINIMKEFVTRRKQELGNNISLLIILESNNIFKSIINTKKFSSDTEVKILFLPKNLMHLNRINLIWDNVRRFGYTVEGKSSSQIKEEVEQSEVKMFW